VALAAAAASTRAARPARHRSRLRDGTARRRPAFGTFRAIRFDGGEDEPHQTGRRALAEAAGSLAPNTFVVGIDGERQLILAHQLRPTGGRETIDPLELG
jgi:hypothetical protein